jgi:hypothetical protein
MSKHFIDVTMRDDCQALIQDAELERLRAENADLSIQNDELRDAVRKAYNNMMYYYNLIARGNS